MSTFKWDKKKEIAALALANGKTQLEAAAEAEVTDRSIRRWLMEPEFSEEVDRLTLMTDIATRAERLRMAKRVVQTKFKDGVPQSDKDLLEWLKFAQSETDGIKLELTSLLEATTSLAGSGPHRLTTTQSGPESTEE